MNANEIVVAVARALEEAGATYMLVGSFSSNMYGTPRSTKDADLVVEFGTASIVEVARRLGPEFALDPQMSFETVTGTMRHKLRHPASGFLVELFLLSGDPYDQSRFARRVRKPFLDGEVYVASAEDVVVNKLRWRRPKDREDVIDVIAAQASALDWAYVRQWCQTFGTLDALDAAIAEAT